MTGSLHPMIHPSIHLSIHYPIHPFTFYSLPYQSIHYPIHPFIHSPVHSLPHPFIHSPVHSLSHPFIHSSIHLSIQLSIHPFIQSSIHRASWVLVTQLKLATYFNKTNRIMILVMIQVINQSSVDDLMMSWSSGSCGKLR